LGTGGVGKAGNIQITTGSLSVTNSAQISSFSDGQGNAGNITLNARDTITFDGVVEKSPLGGSAITYLGNNGIGNAGNISVSARALFLKNGGQLLAESIGGQGNAGNITINAADTVVIDGMGINGSNSGVQTFGIGNSNAGDIQLTTGTLSLTNGGTLSSSSKANAGNITVNARDAIAIDGTVSNGTPSSINSILLSGGVGKGGNIQLITNSLTVSNGGLLESFTAGQGDAGNINLSTGSFSLTNGSELLSGTAGRGNGGDININARDSVTLNGAGSNGGFTGVFSGVSIGGVGKAGNLNLTTSSLSLNNGAQLATSTVFGNGGDIKVTAQDYILLRNGSLISTNAGTANAGGNGGNISINTPFVIAFPLENSDITANAFSGSGGRVSINATNLFNITPLSRQDLERLLGTNDPTKLDPQRLQTNDITAVSQQNANLNRTVQIRTPDIDPGRTLVNLPTVNENPPKLVSSSCTAFNEVAGGNNFTVTGRGGLPPSPYEPLTSDAIWSDTRLPQTTAHKHHPKEHTAKIKPKPIAIVPATGWVFNGKGEVTLISSVSNTTSSTPPTSCPAR
jgi:large exoprotein involved in heme utilization and adhesion